MIVQLTTILPPHFVNQKCHMAPFSDSKADCQTSSYSTVFSSFIYRVIISNEHVESSINDCWRVLCYSVSVSGDSVGPVMTHGAIPSSLQITQNSEWTTIKRIIPLLTNENITRVSADLLEKNSPLAQFDLGFRCWGILSFSCISTCHQALLLWGPCWRLTRLLAAWGHQCLQLVAIVTLWHVGGNGAASSPVLRGRRCGVQAAR